MATSKSVEATMWHGRTRGRVAQTSILECGDTTPRHKRRAHAAPGERGARRAGAACSRAAPHIMHRVSMVAARSGVRRCPSALERAACVAAIRARATPPPSRVGCLTGASRPNTPHRAPRAHYGEARAPPPKQVNRFARPPKIGMPHARGGALPGTAVGLTPPPFVSHGVSPWLALRAS